VIVNDYGGTLDGMRGTISRAQSVVDEITANGGTAVADGHDISQQSETIAIVNDAVANFGTVHILVNNAGTAGAMSAHDNVNIQSFTRVWEIAALGSILMLSAVYPIMQKQGFGRIINTSSDSIYGLGAGGDAGYCSSKGAVFAMTRDLGKFSAQHGIKINGVLPSAASRMSDLSPTIKRITREYFPTALVAPFVCALAADECPVSGELFSVGGGRAARTSFVTFPGHSKEETAEGYIAHFDEVMGKVEDAYVPSDCLDQVSYAIKHATGIDLGKIDLN
jgi:NAD(P)-dependent dehydrogenase (short-subunit alcohol dehydrogenase family)